VGEIDREHAAELVEQLPVLGLPSLVPQRSDHQGNCIQQRTSGRCRRPCHLGMCEQLIDLREQSLAAGQAGAAGCQSCVKLPNRLPAPLVVLTDLKGKVGEDSERGDDDGPRSLVLKHRKNDLA
jgi:hypothetical protein